MADQTASIEERRIEAEIDKLRAESEAIRRRPNFFANYWMPLIASSVGLVTGLGGAAALISAIATWDAGDVTNKQRQLEADKRVFEAQQAEYKIHVQTDALSKQVSDQQASIASQQTYIANLKSQVDALSVQRDKLAGSLSTLQTVAEDASTSALRTTLLNATGELSQLTQQIAQHGRLVYVQFRGRVSRSVVQHFQAMVQKQGFTAPGVERIDGAYSSEVRYFREEDSTAATQLASLASKYFSDQCGAPIHFAVTPPHTRSRTTEQLEVWIALNCPKASAE